jgi:hypothetical protein
VYSQLQGELSPVVAAPAKADSGGKPPPSVMAAPCFFSASRRRFLRVFSYSLIPPVRFDLKNERLSSYIWGGSWSGISSGEESPASFSTVRYLLALLLLCVEPSLPLAR